MNFKFESVINTIKMTKITHFLSAGMGVPYDNPCINAKKRPQTATGRRFFVTGWRSAATLCSGDHTGRPEQSINLLRRAGLAVQP